MSSQVWLRLLADAVRQGASDIHFNWIEGGELEVRLRLDGRLVFTSSYEEETGRRMIGHLKAIAGLDIAERRLPQDGRIKHEIDGRPIELRVTTIGTITGENVALRVLDAGRTGLSLDDLGMDADELKAMHRMLASPHGLILVTGPTGCGKTTALYACLAHVRQIAEGAHVITVEDPVERVLPGVVQVPISPRAGVTFPHALKSILRMDPDCIMIGEIRDPETAEIAVRAGLTGHLVLSSMHTANAAGAPVTLIDWGVDAPLVAAALVGVVAPRLVRTICPDCKTQGSEDSEAPFWFGRGCDACSGTGYRGRHALFEVMPISREIRILVRKGASVEAIQRQASGDGVKLLLTKGLEALRAGLTTADELTGLQPPT